MPFDGKLPAKPDGAAAHLIRAKAYIQKHGWSSNGAFGSNGEVCMAVALNNTVKSLSDRKAYQILADVMGQKGYNNTTIGLVIGLWNDTHHYDEVMVAFDKAIDAALIAESVDAT